jgi:hypothetical protein
VICKVKYTVDDEGSIIIPSEAPFDGKPYLIRFPSGWCEAWWDEGRIVQHQEGAEYEGFQWVCMDDSFQEELDNAKEWTELPR